MPRTICNASTLALAAALCFSATARAAAPERAPAPAPLAELVKQVDIPYETFTLRNDLRVLVHTDRKAPIVGVTVYYRVGSKNEPRGHTGFAHLYEHLFFGGSENVPSFDVPLEAAGSTPTNGSTWYDRTNYVETVPTGALDLALFMESDRMGHLIGALSQDKLNKQRGVVQNEKRQGDNQPLGLMRYALGDGLFPVGHPYRHTTIGSIADLDAATLDDVKRWFVDHYGPNNVVLALAGDIEIATARPAVERWFGDIPKGKAVAPVKAPIVTLPAPISREMTDQVPDLNLFRAWSGPGLNDPDRWPLEVGMSVLGGLSSSRLDNALVRSNPIAVSVSASSETNEQMSILQATMDVKPGVARAEAEAAFDKVIADYLAQGPNVDEVRRAATRLVVQQIDQLEQVGGFSGKGAQLAEGLLYQGDPAIYRKDLATIAALTPERVHAALNKWLSRPALAITVSPGERTEKGAELGGWSDGALDLGMNGIHPAPPPPVAYTPGPRREPATVKPIKDLELPPIEHAALSNGIEVAFVRRTAVPKVLVSLDFDAGYAADTATTQGTQSLMLALLDEGTDADGGARTSIGIAEEQERLGASIGTEGTLDSTSVRLSALTTNLVPSLALMADVVRHPAFAPAEVMRVKAQRLAEIAENASSPVGLVRAVIGPLAYGAAHPYGISQTGLGTAASVVKLDAAALRAEHQTWFRPDLATISVVGDTTLAKLVPLLEAAFGTWKAPATPAPRKDLSAPVPAPRSRIVVIDRPNSPQSVIAAVRVLPVNGGESQYALDLANGVLGGDFLSRLNLDLREDKAWSYGVSSQIGRPKGPRMLTVIAPVQADKTGASIKALFADMKAFPATKGTAPGELARVTEGNIRALPGEFETNAQLLTGIVNNRKLGRPETYYTQLASHYRAVDAKTIDAAAAQYLQPEGLVTVVVGDRKVIDPQLKDLGLPIEYMAVDKPVGNGGE